MNYKGLIIGVNKYKDSTITALDKVIVDVMAIGNILSSSHLGYEKNLQAITGKDATVLKITNELEDFLTNCNQNDILFLYWAGHGSSNNDGCFITYDTECSCMTHTNIPMNAVRQLIENSPAKAIISLFDCCYSGAITRAEHTFHDLVARELKVTGEGKVIITACTEFQVAYEMEMEPHGRFTYYLIEGLKGAAADPKGNIPITGLYQYVAEKMKSHSEIQRPVLHCKMSAPIVVAKINEIVRDFNGQKNKNEFQVNESAQWCLINGHPFQYNSIEDDGAKLSLEILNPPASQTVFLKKFTEVSPWGLGKEIQIAFSEIYYEGTASIKIAIAGGNTVYKILIDKKQNQRQVLSEMSVGLGGATITPLQIAELRARRILLAEERNMQFSYSEWESLKTYIMGFTQDYRPLLEKLPIPECISRYKDNGFDGWQIIRLFMVYYLSMTNTIDHVSVLELYVVDNRLEVIEFVGVRRSIYSNSQDDIIAFKDKYVG